MSDSCAHDVVLTALQQAWLSIETYSTHRSIPRAFRLRAQIETRHRCRARLQRHQEVQVTRGLHGKHDPGRRATVGCTYERCDRCLSFIRLIYRAFILGSPPAYRGSDLPGRDIELKLLKHFPGIPLFVEKPVSTGPASKTFEIASSIQKSQTVCSVGYAPMFHNQLRILLTWTCF